MPQIVVKQEWASIPAYRKEQIRRFLRGALLLALWGILLLAVGWYWGYSAAWSALQAACICMGGQ